MIERQPLMEVQNEAFTRRKIKNTYGKKGKASAALVKIFTMPEEIDKKFGEMKIEESVKDESRGEESESKSQLQQKKSKAKPPQSSESHATKLRSKSTKEMSLLSKYCADLKEQSPERVAGIIGLLDRFEAQRKEKQKREEEQKKQQQEEEDSIELTAHFTPVLERPVYDPPEISQTADWEAKLVEFVSKCSEHPITSFQSYGKQVGEYFDIKKVGEGTYSSVFRLHPKDRSSTQSSSRAKTHIPTDRTTVVKLVPILLPHQQNHRSYHQMTKPTFIANESSIMQLMDSLNGFVRFRGLTICKGALPEEFLQAFRAYAKKYRARGQNEDPAAAFDEDQHFALFEMGNAGTELHDIARPSDFQMRDIFWMTALHLAQAEQYCQFEHRDLHVSNICLEYRDASILRCELDEDLTTNMVERPKNLLGMTNISINIIDYTFSRMTMKNGEVNFRRFRRGSDDVSYNSLVEQDFLHDNEASRRGISSTGKEIYEKLGAERRVQTYTYAKQVQIVADAYAELVAANQQEQKKLPSPWEVSATKTNVVWLGYLATCLLQRVGKIERTKYVRGSSKMAKAIQDDIRKDMEEVRDFLMQDDLAALPASAGELVAVAVERGWLDQGEVQAFWESLESE